MKFQKILKAGIKYFTNKNYRFLINAGSGKYNSISDKVYLEKKFEAHMNQKLDFDEPQTFNEKLQWLKLNDRKSEYSMMVDKYAVRKYIADTIGQEYLIPLLGVWDSVDEIDFDKLPSQFVLKCNHNSGLGMCICKDKSKLNIDKVRRELRKGLAQNYYLTGREWPYKNVKPRIIAEKYMEDCKEELSDYKVHNFNGIPKFILVCRDRFKNTGLTEDFYDDSWNHLDVKRPAYSNPGDQPCPSKLDLMLKLSKMLAKDIPFIRTDFYIIHEKLFFGELTFFPASGFSKFEPEEWDSTFGSWIDLSNVERFEN